MSLIVKSYLLVHLRIWDQITSLGWLISKSSVLSFFSFILVISPIRAHIAEYVTDSGGMIDNIDLKIAHILCISKYTHIYALCSVNLYLDLKHSFLQLFWPTTGDSQLWMASFNLSPQSWSRLVGWYITASASFNPSCFSASAPTISTWSFW